MKARKINRRAVLAAGILVAFVMAVFSVSIYQNFRVNENRKFIQMKSQTENMTREELRSAFDKTKPVESNLPPHILIPVVAFAGILIGTLVYYLLSEKIVEQETTLVKQEKTLENNAKVILNFLTPNERKVIHTLLENNGKVKQYELTYLPGLNKVKTHRIIKDLAAKGVIKKEKLGRVNRIVLDKELYQVLKD